MRAAWTARALLALALLASGLAWWHFGVRRAPRAPASAHEDARAASRPVAGAREALPQAAGAPNAPAHPPAPELAPHAAQEPLPAALDDAARCSAWNEDGIAALEHEDFALAVELFERCVLARPSEPTFRHNLAEALARLAAARYSSGASGSLELAIEALARAVELAPDRVELAQRLERWRRVAEEERGFWSDASEHFELSYDGERSELLWSSFLVLEVLETAYQELGELFVRYPVEDGRARIRVVLYRRPQFEAVTGIGHWAGGVFDGTVRVPVEDLGREEASLRRVLRHELVHVFVRAVGGARVPSWLDEGLAQRLELSSGAQPLERVRAARRALAGQALHPLARLESGLSGWSDAAEIRKAYDEALAFVAWLETSFGERLPFELVRAAGDGIAPAQHFASVLQVDLERAWSEFGAGL